MKYATILMSLAVAIGGCGFMGEQTLRNQKQWRQTRAKIIYGVGREHFKAGDMDRARSSAMEALDLDQDLLPARLLLAKTLLAKGQYANAIGELQNLESAAPSSAEVPYLIGEALERTGRNAEALKNYEKARLLEPSDDAYVTASAQMMVSMGNPERAMELLEARLSQAGGEPEMLLLAGEVAMLVDQPGKAAEFFRQCLDVNSKSLAVRESLAKACFFAKRYGEAIENLKRLAESRGRDRQSSWIYIMMGDGYMALNRFGPAGEAYETASNIEPDDWRVWLSLAKSAVAIGDADRASFAARRALDLNEASLDAAVVLSHAMLMNNQWRDAIGVLAQAVRNRPEDPMLWCMLGLSYAAGGQNDRAATCYMLALKADPGHDLARNLLAASTGAGDGP